MSRAHLAIRRRFAQGALTCKRMLPDTVEAGGDMNCSTGEVSSTLKGTDNVEPWFPALSTARTSSDYEEGSGARWMCYTQGAAAHGAPSRPLQRRTHAPAGSLTLLRLILRGLSRSTGHVRYCCAGSLERAH